VTAISRKKNSKILGKRIAVEVKQLKILNMQASRFANVERELGGEG